MRKINIPIVISAFRKPKSLKRLLLSLNVAHFSSRVKLIISIDGAGDNAVNLIAKEFDWKHGEKEVIVHEENKGLRKHIHFCGSLSQQYDGIILLEDDLFVSPMFYQFALNAANFCANDNTTCGVSLYSPNYNETTYLPFHPLTHQNDCYYMQLPCSWGQVWLKEQWHKYSSWYQNNKYRDLSTDMNLPHNIRKWPKTSWKKFFLKYMLEENKYFLYPYVSYTTNFGDTGQHHTGTHLYQVPLFKGKQSFNFTCTKLSNVKYDAFGEIKRDCLIHWCSWLKDYDFDVDLHGAKEKEQIKSDFVLTSKRCTKIIKSFSKSLLPIECNIINAIDGNKLFFAKSTDLENVDDMNEYRWLKANDSFELFYYYPMDKRHLALQANKLDFLREKNNKLKDKASTLEKNVAKLKSDNDDALAKLEIAKQEIINLRNSHSYRLGHKIISPLSYLKKYIIK